MDRVVETLIIVKYVSSYHIYVYLVNKYTHFEAAIHNQVGCIPDFEPPDFKTATKYYKKMVNTSICT